MEPDRLFSPDKMSQGFNKHASGLNGASYSSENRGTEIHNDGTLEGNTMKKFLELEKRNASLERTIELHKEELASTIDSNKKYISILAHDLKTPFSSIYGVLGMLKECIRENKINDMEEYIEIASSSALNTTNLIENILAWATSQSKKNRFHPARINLSKLVVQEIESSKLTVKLKNVSLEHSINQDIFVYADLQMTETILRNLINNAIKFSKAGGNITLSVKETELMIEITIKDNGIGISPERQLELFKESSAKSNSKNGYIARQGLGLMLCKEFVNIHGGTIWVESLQGKGSNFSFTLPKMNNADRSDKS